MNTEKTMQDETLTTRRASIIATNGTSAKATAGFCERTIGGVECACCGADIRRGARRIMNAKGDHCSYECAREPS